MLDARNDTTQLQAKLDEIQIAFSFPLGYFVMLYALLLCWIGVYVASLTIGIRRFKLVANCSTCSGEDAANANDFEALHCVKQKLSGQWNRLCTQQAEIIHTATL